MSFGVVSPKRAWRCQRVLEEKTLGKRCLKVPNGLLKVGRDRIGLFLMAFLSKDEENLEIYIRQEDVFFS